MSRGDLTGTHLSGAIFVEANLSGAWLSGANLTQQQLNSARGDDQTKLSAGLQRPAHWSVGSAPSAADR